MIRSFLIGLVAGQRGITPLAAIAAGTRSGEIPAELPLQKLFLNPAVAVGTAALTAAEMAGDKLKSAPDRVVPIGLAVRSVTAAYAGAALAPRDKQRGSKLTIATPNHPAQVLIVYITSPAASGLQWLTPAQTADKKLPCMFSQSESIQKT